MSADGHVNADWGLMVSDDPLPLLRFSARQFDTREFWDRICDVALAAGHQGDHTVLINDPGGWLRFRLWCLECDCAVARVHIDVEPRVPEQMAR